MSDTTSPGDREQLAASSIQTGARGAAVKPAGEPALPPPDVEFVLVGRNQGGLSAGRVPPVRVLAYLGATDDPDRVLASHRSSYGAVRWARATTTYEAVDIATVQRERDR